MKKGIRTVSSGGISALLFLSEAQPRRRSVRAIAGLGRSRTAFSAAVGVDDASPKSKEGDDLEFTIVGDERLGERETRPRGRPACGSMTKAVRAEPDFAPNGGESVWDR